MARLLFPDESVRLAYRLVGTQVNAVPGGTVLVYSDAGATTLADIQHLDLTAVTGSSLTIDAYGLIPQFYGPPNGATTVYAVINGGPVAALVATDPSLLAAVTGGGAAAQGLLWSDEFTEPALNYTTDSTPGTWRTRPIEAPGSVAHGYTDYASATWLVPAADATSLGIASIAGSVLTLKAIRNPGSGVTDNPANLWLGIQLSTDAAGSGLSWTYGYFEVRVRFPNPSRGMYPAIWMLNNDTPRTLASDGAEIDLFEVFGSSAGQPYSGGTHYGHGGIPGGVSTEQAYSLTDTDIINWHRYGVDWQPDHMTFYRDGVAVGSISAAGVQFFRGASVGMRLDYVMDPTFVDSAHQSTPTDPVIGTQPRMEVDYVRVYTGITSALMTGVSTDPINGSVIAAVGNTNTALAVRADKGALNSEPLTAGVRTITTGSYTLQAFDAGGELQCSTACLITIPPGVLPIGARVGIRQMGIGQVVVASGSGVTLQGGRKGFGTAGQFARVEVRATTAATVDVSGDATTVNPSIVQSAKFQTSSPGTAGTVTLAAAPTPGNLLVFAVSYKAAVGATVTPTTSGWASQVLVNNANANSDTDGVQIWAKVAGVTEPAAQAYTITGITDGHAGVVYEIANASSVSSAVLPNLSGTTFTTPTLTPAVLNCLPLAFGAQTSAQTISVSAGFTIDQAAASSFHPIYAASGALTSALTAVSATFTSGTSLPAFSALLLIAPRLDMSFNRAIADSVYVPLSSLSTTALVVFGSGAPSSGVGLNGDLYQDTATGNYWGPKSGGAWPGSPVFVAGATAATETTRAQTAEALLAPKASPALTGTPTAPTATALDNSTKLSTTAYTDAAVAGETSRATTAEALKAPLASPALTGSPTAPTATALDSTTKLATTAFTTGAVGVETARATAAEALKAPIVAGAAASTSILAAGITPITVDAAGPYAVLATIASPGFMEQPSAVFLPNGNIAFSFRSVASGSDTSGAGAIWFGVCSPNGTILTAPASVAADVNSTPLDCRGGCLTILADGRLMLCFNTNPASTGNPNGMNGQNGSTNPDGLNGNIRYILGTISGNTVTWVGGATPTQKTIVTGFTPATGFDSTGYDPVLEPTTGNLILPVAGANTSLVWSNTLDIVGYCVGTYSPGGTITWGTFNTIPALAGHTTGEPSIAGPLSDGNYFTIYRDSASSQAVYSKTTNGATATTNLVAGTATWQAAAVLPNIGTQCYADPALLLLKSGALAFISRSSAAYALGSNLAVMGTSIDNGVTWQIQPLDNDYNTNLPSSFYYGRLLENPAIPGQLLAVYASGTYNSNSQVRLRYATQGAGWSPLGGETTPSVSTQMLRAAQAQVGGIIVPAGPISATSRDIGQIAKPGVTAGNQRHIYAGNHDLPEYQTRRTDIAVQWQNMPIAPLSDVTGALVSGTLYIWQAQIDSQAQFRYIRIHWGNTAPTTTHAWATYLTSAQALILSSTDVTSTLAANTSTKFDLGSTQTVNGQGLHYLGLCVVGTVMPSILGAPTFVEVSGKAPIYCGPTTSTSLTVPGGFSGTATFAGGGTLLPYVELSTT